MIRLGAAVLRFFVGDEAITAAPVEEVVESEDMVRFKLVLSVVVPPSQYLVKITQVMWKLTYLE
jgi:hypothetical protein